MDNYNQDRVLQSRCFLKYWFVIIISIGYCYAQQYAVTLWGLPIGSAEIKQVTNGEITLQLKSNEIVDYLRPVNLEYYAKYDKSDYSVIESWKKTSQGDENQKFEAQILNKSTLIYDKKDTISVAPKTLSMLSFLAKLMNSNVDEIDTKWFNLENEGIIYKTRLLWSDSTAVSVNGKDISCDHYRWDLKIIDDDKTIFDKTDYFNDLFFDINSIRQIWVEKWQKQRKIIKIALKNKQRNLSIVIED